MWEKMPELNWSLLGEDVVGMIEDFKVEIAAKVPIHPAVAVERSSEVVSMTTETVDHVAQEISGIAPPAEKKVDDSTKLPNA